MPGRRDRIRKGSLARPPPAIGASAAGAEKDLLDGMHVAPVADRLRYLMRLLRALGRRDVGDRFARRAEKMIVRIRVPVEVEPVRRQGQLLDQILGGKEPQRAIDRVESQRGQFPAERDEDRLGVGMVGTLAHRLENQRPLTSGGDPAFTEKRSIIGHECYS